MTNQTRHCHLSRNYCWENFRCSSWTDCCLGRCCSRCWCRSRSDFCCVRDLPCRGRRHHRRRGCCENAGRDRLRRHHRDWSCGLGDRPRHGLSCVLGDRPPHPRRHLGPDDFCARRRHPLLHRGHDGDRRRHHPDHDPVDVLAHRPPRRRPVYGRGRLHHCHYAECLTSCHRRLRLSAGSRRHRRRRTRRRLPRVIPERRDRALPRPSEESCRRCCRDRTRERNSRERRRYPERNKTETVQRTPPFENAVGRVVSAVNLSWKRRPGLLRNGS